MNVDRNTPMLLPPDLRECVSEDDMVRFAIEAVVGMNLPAQKVTRRGVPGGQLDERKHGQDGSLSLESSVSTGYDGFLMFDR